MDENKKKAVTIAFMNNKGGVGKTTLSAGIAYAFSLQGKKVLLIDTDGQGNLSTLFGYKPNDDSIEMRLSDLLLKKVKKEPVDAREYILETDFENIDIITGEGELDAIRGEVGMALTKNRRVYKQIINDIRALDYYDYIFFDTAPSLDNSSLQVMLATDYLIIPASDDMFSTQGIKVTLELLDNAKEWGEDIEFLGVILNIIPAKGSLTADVRDYIDSQEETKGKIFKAIGKYSMVAKNISWKSLSSMSKKNQTFLTFDAARKEIEEKIGQD